MKKEEILKNLKQLKTKYESDGVIIKGLFGSFAKGIETDFSDIDIAYSLDRDKFSSKFVGGFAKLNRLDEIKYELESLYKRKVDFISLDSKNRDLNAKISSELIDVYSFKILLLIAYLDFIAFVSLLLFLVKSSAKKRGMVELLNAPLRNYGKRSCELPSVKQHNFWFFPPPLRSATIQSPTVKKRFYCKNQVNSNQKKKNVIYLFGILLRRT